MYFWYWGSTWVNRKIQPFLHQITSQEHIIDIGSGSGLVAYMLRKKGFHVTPLDVADLSYEATVRPIVYDGVRMPFEDKQFDVALLLTVLHHTPQPDVVLREACRIAKRVIIIEDIYDNEFQRKMTFAMDGFVNWGYADCPHTNKDDEVWRSTFARMGMTLESVAYRKVLLFFKQAIYVLKHEWAE